MIPLLDLAAQYRSLQPEIDAAVSRVLASGRFILGPEVSALEAEVADYLGVRHAVGVASGTDALVLALRACDIGPGDEVIVPAYTFFATAGTVLSVGARPVFVDIDPYTYTLDVSHVRAHITPHTKAIIPVHLFGHPAAMAELLDLAARHGLAVIEDNAQAFGARCQGRRTGSLGDIGCLSFFPTKNLGAYGDGGMLTTNRDDLAARLRRLRTHGWQKKYYPEELGYNSRLDELQAAVLRVKLPHVDAWNLRRNELAARYTEQLKSLNIAAPFVALGVQHVFHLFVLNSPSRDALQAALHAAGVAAEVYYPQPVYLAKPCQHLGYAPEDFPEALRASRQTVAIPLYPEMTSSQVDFVLSAVAGALKEMQ